jgi:hypothetical protein
MSALLVWPEKSGSYGPYDKLPAETRITSLTEADLVRLDDFYTNVLQNLKPWSPPAPKLRAKTAEVEKAGTPPSSDLSSMDEVPMEPKDG